MARGYRPVDRDQRFLLAPDMRDWLAPDHLVWTVLDLVAAVDTSGFHARARRGSVGRAGYDPDMLLGLLLYGYAVGVRSTRAIERLCATDVAFRVACAQDVPDHTTLARFRQDHEGAFVDLFARVLTLASAAGLAQFGTIAIDGTKIPANASLDANRTRAWLQAQAARVVAEAAATDAVEDAAEDERGPGGPPPGWTDPAARRARIDQLVAELDKVATGTVRVEASTRATARYDGQVAAGQLPNGRPPDDGDRVGAARLRVERARAAQQARIDAWQARQAAGQRGGRPPVPVEASRRVARARERLATAEDVQDAAGRAPDEPGGGNREPRVNLTDPQSRIQKTRKGWIQGYNAQLAVTADQTIVACSLGQNQADAGSFIPMMNAAVDAADRLTAATGRDNTIGTVLADAGYASQDNLTSPGPDRLIALGKAHTLDRTARTNPTSGPPDPNASPRDQMAHRLATANGAALYKRRAATAEPGIGNLKKILPRLSRRGLAAATAELHLAATVFNMLKIHRLAAT